MLRWRTCEEIIKRGFAQLMKAEGLARIATGAADMTRVGLF